MATGLNFLIYCTIRIAKTKALISFAVTAKLICAFVFTYAKSWFSYNEAHILCPHYCKKHLAEFESDNADEQLYDNLDFSMGTKVLRKYGNE